MEGDSKEGFNNFTFVYFWKIIQIILYMFFVLYLAWMNILTHVDFYICIFSHFFLNIWILYFDKMAYSVKSGKTIRGFVSQQFQNKKFICSLKFYWILYYTVYYTLEIKM